MSASDDGQLGSAAERAACKLGGQLTRVSRRPPGTATRAFPVAGNCSTSMPKPLSDQEQQSFLAERHIAVLSVARGSGRPPLSTPIWYAYKTGGNVTFFTGVNASKLKVIQRAGVVSLTVQREEPPYRFVSIAGTVVSTDSPPSSDQIFAITRRYLPEDAARWMASANAETRGYELILLTIRPDRWQSADYTDDMT
jgi:uncharacterized protein